MGLRRQEGEVVGVRVRAHMERMPPGLEETNVGLQYRQVAPTSLTGDFRLASSLVAGAGRSSSQGDDLRPEGVPAGHLAGLLGEGAGPEPAHAVRSVAHRHVADSPGLHVGPQGPHTQAEPPRGLLWRQTHSGAR